MKLKLAIALFILSFCVSHTIFAQDFAKIGKYKQENLELKAPKSREDRVVFIGNSIIEIWGNYSPRYFSRNSYINRGISGQTSVHVLTRFRSDVISLKPKMVVILVGINDIVGKLGPTTDEMIVDNIISMVELAKANGIKVLLCSILPTHKFSLNAQVKTEDRIIHVNSLIKAYAVANDIEYLDYYTSMVDPIRRMKKEYTRDGIHPNESGYEMMEPLTDEAIKKVLTK